MNVLLYLVYLLCKILICKVSNSQISSFTFFKFLKDSGSRAQKDLYSVYGTDMVTRFSIGGFGNRMKKKSLALALLLRWFWTTYFIPWPICLLAFTNGETLFFAGTQFNEASTTNIGLGSLNWNFVVEAEKREHNGKIMLILEAYWRW